MRHFPVVALVMLTSLAASTAEAQVCEGRAARSAGNFAVGADFVTGNDARQLSAGVTGIGTGVYGGASVGSISYDGLSGSTTTVGGALGYQLAMGETGRAQICPYASGTVGFGPKDIAGLGIDMSSSTFGAGLSWGYQAHESADLTLVPTVSAGVAHASIKLTDGVDDLTESETFGQVNLGVGFVLARRFAITPSVMIPVGLDDSDPMFSVSARLSFGTKR